MQHHPAIESYIASYFQRKDYFRHAAEHCHGLCREALEQNGIRHIATYRVKRQERLRIKLYQRLHAGKTYATKEDIESDIVDLAGVRVALYFPGDLREAEKALEARFAVHGTPRFPRDRPSPPAYAYRFSGYSAVHLRVRMRPDSLPVPAQHYDQAQIEIQIASVFMHAWAEVEHDLVYKPERGAVSVDEFAFLDQVNGLAIAGEVALEQLQRAMNDRVARDRHVFESQYDLAAYIHAALRPTGGADEPAMGRADRLLAFIRGLNLARPHELHPFLTTPLQGSRPIVEQVVDRIVSADASSATKRRALWNDLSETADPHDAKTVTSPSPPAPSPSPERLLRRRWQTFEKAATRILARRASTTPGAATDLWLTREQLQLRLALDSQTAAALIEAHHACVRVNTDRWMGGDDQLTRHADTLARAIQHLSRHFPDLEDEPNPHR